MGRGSKKHWSETHPDRHLWTEAQRVHAGMQSQAEYEALYGRGQIASSGKLRSPLFSCTVSRQISAADREELWQKIDREKLAQLSAPELLRDPVFSFLGARDARDLIAEEDRLQDELQEAGWSSYQFDSLGLELGQLQRDWSESTTGAKEALPVFLFSAAIGKSLPWEEFLQRWEFLRDRDRLLYEQICRERILPDISFFLENDDPGERIARSKFFNDIYQFLRTDLQSLGPDVSIGHRFLYGHMLRSGGGVNFERRPLLLEDCGAGEAALRRFLKGSGDREEFAAIEKALFADQIARILVCGSREPHPSAEEEFRQQLRHFAKEGGSNPLQNLQPLLQDRFGDLDQKMRTSPPDSFWRAEAERGELLSHIFYSLHRNDLGIDHIEGDLYRSLVNLFRL